eukprot:NODE_795_length_4189_cov_0.531785.p1 type:complete len:401 gc:universal NODE_795_length_4189_cov_0.531785:896-2098(+)
MVNFKMLSNLLMISIVSSISEDCLKVEKLALGLHMNIKQPELMNDITTDCCTSKGIQCKEERVSVINWSGLTLDGEILGDAIPTSLERLFLGTIGAKKNAITGSIPVLPDSLQYFYADSNALTGTIPNPLPADSIEIVLNTNKLTGGIPAMPYNMKSFQAASNKLSGNLPSKFNDELEIFSVWGNLVTGKIPQVIPPKMWVFYVGGNRLYGNVPIFPKTLRYLGLGNAKGNRLSGAVQLSNPVYLSINYNYITNVVLEDSSFLNSCDISYNPLLEHYDDPQLAKCKKIGLYSAYSLPSTVELGTATLIEPSKTQSDEGQLSPTPDDPVPDLPPPIPSHSFKDLKPSKTAVLTTGTFVILVFLGLGAIVFVFLSTKGKKPTSLRRDFELSDNNEESDQLIK